MLISKLSAELGEITVVKTVIAHYRIWRIYWPRETSHNRCGL